MIAVELTLTKDENIRIGIIDNATRFEHTRDLCRSHGGKALVPFADMPPCIQPEGANRGHQDT